MTPELSHIEIIENAIITAVKADVPVQEIKEAIGELWDNLELINNQLKVIHSFE
jgi:hypothetical protein|tara:strand:- start:432 stop:593 length:162 start_codon:yes stop_codon:yes gene_type:complete